jgi:hypothetical protein
MVTNAGKTSFFQQEEHRYYYKQRGRKLENLGRKTDRERQKREI